MKKDQKDDDFFQDKSNKFRNVISEIQRVDQETADLRTVVQEAQKINKSMNEVKKKDVIYACRLLFASVFDKIFIVLLFLFFIIASWINLRGNIFLGTYDYWNKIIREIGILILLVVLYFIFNWIYKCISKTILCLTKNSIYKESYFPLGRSEIVIPLSSISSISTINFCVIFRLLIIRQYNHLPILFYTWDNRRFKRKYEELRGEGGRLKNSFEVKNIINGNFINVIKWFFIVFIMILFLLGITNAIGYLFSPESRIVGSYIYEKEKIELKSNGTCLLKLNGIKKLHKCKWKFNSEYNQVIIRYEYDKVNAKGDISTLKDSFAAPCGNRVLMYKGVKFTRE